MLKEIVKNGYFSFQDHIDSWEEAIKKSYSPLIEKEIVNDKYVQQVIECVKKYGPYIVISEEVAMPHTTENAEGCFGTAISFMKVNDYVDFGEDVDGRKQARLFFSLASIDHEAHMKNIQELMEVLMNEEIIEALLKCNDGDELAKIADKFE